MHCPGAAATCGGVGGVRGGAVVGGWPGGFCWGGPGPPARWAGGIRGGLLAPAHLPRCCHRPEAWQQPPEPWQQQRPGTPTSPSPFESGDTFCMRAAQQEQAPPHTSQLSPATHTQPQHSTAHPAPPSPPPELPRSPHHPKPSVSPPGAHLRRKARELALLRGHGRLQVVHQPPRQLLLGVLRPLQDMGGLGASVEQFGWGAGRGTV